jgi:glycosyltransferase involved in cell wall biosynthesis
LEKKVQLFGVTTFFEFNLCLGYRTKTFFKYIMMPKLLSINSYHYHRDGSESVYLDHNRMFSEAGWGVVPFAMHHPQNLDTRWSDHFVREIEYGQRYSLLQKATRVPKVIYSLESRQKISRLIAAAKPDIAHCHSIYHHISPSILDVLRSRHIPTVMTLHDLKIACPAYHMFDRGEICERCKGGRIHQVLLRRCIKSSIALSAVIFLEAALHKMLKTYEKGVDKFVVPCKFYLEKLVQWGWDSDQFVHIPNFVDADRFNPQINSGEGFLYFGRLSPEKGLTTLIRSAAQSGARVMLAGDGPQRPLLAQQVRESGADVVFLGRLDREDLHKAVRSSRATVLPSEWFENAPISILESYALGKPVIGARIGGIPELIAEGQSGFTFESGSVEQLAALLGMVENMPGSDVAQMGQFGRALAETKFSKRRYFKRITALYADLDTPC